RGRDLVWVGDEGCEHPRLVPAGLPELNRERMVAAELARHAPQLRHGYAEDLWRSYRIPRHALDVGPASALTQRGQDRPRVGIVESFAIHARSTPAAFGSLVQGRHVVLQICQPTIRAALSCHRASRPSSSPNAA